MNTIRQALTLLFAGCLVGCGGDGLVDQSCDEPQLYQSAAESNRVVVPEGLDPLDERMEMPIPKPTDVPARPQGSPCIELPPRAGSGG